MEVDLLIDKGSSVSLYEIKAVKTLTGESAKALRQVNFRDAKKHIISLYEHSLPLAPGVRTLPWWDIPERDGEKSSKPENPLNPQAG